MGNNLVQLALFAWPVVAAAMFLYLPVRHALLASFLGGWMLLPMATIRFQGIPNIDKSSAIAVGVLLGLALCGELWRLTQVRPHWLDLPMAIWCVLPFISAMSVGLGPYDGVSGIVENVTVWGLPYWFGRAFFNEPAALRTLATGVVVAGLVYLPLCWFEMRFSPQLHNMVYGYHQHDFRQTMRGGGYRPMVFMAHGLMVAMFMATASLMALGLWWSGARRRLFNVPMGWWVALLLITTVLCRSTGASGLLVLGVVSLMMSDRLRMALPVLLLVMLPPIYVFSRIGQTELPQQLVHVAEAVFGETRAASLQYRIDNEQALMHRAWEAPIFGWRGWNLARQVRPGLRPDELPVAESMWIIAFGRHGLTGLTTFFVLMLLVPVMLFRRLPRPLLTHPLGAPVACAGLAIVLFAIDGLFNAMLNPMFLLMIGGAAGLLAAAGARRPATFDVAAPRAGVADVQPR